MQGYEADNVRGKISDKFGKTGVDVTATAANEELSIRRIIMAGSLRLLNHTGTISCDIEYFGLHVLSTTNFFFQGFVRDLACWRRKS